MQHDVLPQSAYLYDPAIVTSFYSTSDVGRIREDLAVLGCGSGTAREAETPNRMRSRERAVAIDEDLRARLEPIYADDRDLFETYVACRDSEPLVQLLGRRRFHSLYRATGRASA